MKHSQTIPSNASELVQFAVQSRDIYLAVAVYDIADENQLNNLQEIICQQRRHTLMLARWQHTPASVLNLLAQLSDDMVQLRIDKNPATNGQTLQQQYRQGRSEKLIGLIALHGHSSAEVLLQIATDNDDLQIIRSVCKNPNSDSRVLAIIVQRFGEQFDSELVMHTQCSGDMLQSLYQHDNVYIKSAVIAHEHCPSSLIDEAATQDDIAILRHVAAKEQLAIEILNRLSNHHDASVRRITAANKTLAAENVDKLAKDELISVRRAIATRALLSAENLELLSQDDDHWVKQWVARNPAMSPELLTVLAQDPDEQVRRAVARNSSCSISLLETLAQDENAWVRAAVAYQKNSSAELLKKLSFDDDIDVLAGVANNGNTPANIMQRLSQSSQDDVRRGVILNKQASRQTLLPLLLDPYYLHRLLLVNNKALTQQDKWTLFDDPDPSVRFVVFKWMAGNLV